MTRVIYEKDFEEARLKDQPYLRANRSDALVLSDSWQRIDFNGTSSFNENLFPVVNGGGKRVHWDGTNDLFQFETDGTLQFFDISLNLAFSGGIRPLGIDLRFVIPDSTPIYFPHPEESSSYIDIALTERRSEVRADHKETIRTSQLILDNGLGIELKTDRTLVSNPSLIDAIIQIHPR